MEPPYYWDTRMSFFPYKMLHYKLQKRRDLGLSLSLPLTPSPCVCTHDGKTNLCCLRTGIHGNLEMEDCLSCDFPYIFSKLYKYFHFRTVSRLFVYLQE